MRWRGLILEDVFLHYILHFPEDTLEFVLLFL